MRGFVRIRSAVRGCAGHGLFATAAFDFVLLFALALALRLHGLGVKPLWLDEVTTRARIALPPHLMFTDSLRNHHLPTYFLLLAALAPGVNAWAMRLPSAIAGAFASALGGAVGRALGGRTAGLMSGLFLAAAPVMVQFGQDARPYAMELAFLLLALRGLVCLAGDEEAAGGRSWRRGLGPWSALLFGTAGALLLIGDAIPFLLAADLAAWPIARRLGNAARWRFLGRWIAGQAVILLAVAPLYWMMNRTVSGQYVDDFAWIPPLGALRTWQIAANVYLLHGADMVSLQLLPTRLPGFAVFVPLLAAAGCLALRRQPAALTAMVFACLSLPVLLFLVHPSHPFWLPRYLLWSGAVFLILAGIGAASSARWLAGGLGTAALAGLAALLLINLLPYYRHDTNPRWDLAATALAPEVDAGADILVDAGGIPLMLRAYLPGGTAALPENRVLRHLSDAEARLHKGRVVIAIHGPVGQGHTVSTAAFLARMKQLGTPARKTVIGAEIVLLRFNPPSPVPGRLEADVQSNP